MTVSPIVIWPSPAITMRSSRRTARTVVERICALLPLSDLSSNFNGDCNGYAMNWTIASACESCQETLPRALFDAKWGMGSGEWGVRVCELSPIVHFPFPTPHSPFPVPHSPMSVMHHRHSAYSLSLRDPEVDSQNRLRYFARLQARRHTVASAA